MTIRIDTKWACVGAAVFLLADLAGAGRPAVPTQPASRPAPIRYGRGVRLARLANPQITESSGLAPSRRHEDVLWTHNDSGDRPRVFAFNLAGQNLGAYTVKGAEARDWEDMASFVTEVGSFLLLADVGDNSRRRKSCHLYIADEPAIAGGKRRSGSMTLRMAIEFTYEDGPRDCEAVAVDPVGQSIYLVSKGPRGKSVVYRLPLPVQPPAGAMVAKAVATLEVGLATAMDMSPDGLRAVVATYLNGYEYARLPGETWAQAFGRKPRRIGLPLRRQGESICYGSDGTTLFLTSERTPTPLLMIRPRRTAPKATSRPATSPTSRSAASQALKPERAAPQK